MKKVYLSVFLACLGYTTNAQYAKLPAKSFSTERTFAKKSSKNPSQKAVGTTVWSNDFSDPGTWVVDNSGQSGATYGWTIDSNVDGWFFGGGTTPDPILSTSGGNFAELNNGDPSATPASQALGVTYTMTTATAVDITSSDLSLNFNQYGALFADLQEVQISIDGGNTFIPVSDNSDLDMLTANGGDVYANPMLKSVNLASFIPSGTTSILIRFSWTSAYPDVAGGNVWITYGWMIDDVSLVNNADYDLYTTSDYWGSEGLNYNQIPLNQVAPIDFSVNVTNGGLQDITNAQLNVDVNSGAWTGSSASAVIVPQSSDSLFLTTQFTPSNTATATYNVTRTITADQTDDIPANNALSSVSFSTTNFIYARDNGTLDGSTSNGTDGFETGNFFDIWSDQTVYAINTTLATGTTAGTEYFAKIYSIDPSTGNFVVEGTTDPFNVTAADLNTELVLKLIDPITLTANSTYLAVVGSEQSGLRVATAGVSYPQTSFFYDYAHPPTNDGWYYQTSTPVVRLNFDPTVGIDEKASAISVASVYPNPTSGETNIQFNVASASNVTLHVTDVTGKVVYTTTHAIQTAGTNQLSFDASSYSNGVYYLTLSSDKGTVTKKFIKK
jgi:hypothetical protein